MQLLGLFVRVFHYQVSIGKPIVKQCLVFVELLLFQWLFVYLLVGRNN